MDTAYTARLILLLTSLFGRISQPTHTGLCNPVANRKTPRTNRTLVDSPFACDHNIAGGWFHTDFPRATSPYGCPRPTGPGPSVLVLLHVSAYKVYDHVVLTTTTTSTETSRIHLIQSLPLSIGIEIILASFDAISEVNMDYTITMYLNQYWADDRLAFSQSENESMTLSGDFAEKIWVPDTFFTNDKNSFLHDVTEKNKMIRLFGNGSIIYGMRFTTTLACMMDLHNYPLDVQNCTVEIESYGYAMSDVFLYWRSGSVHNVDSMELPQFSIVEYRAIEKIESLLTGKYQRLSLSFKLQRNIGYFVFQTYLPSILIVMLSWVSFWINHEATSARVALGITTVLTMTTISNGVRSSLPRISYVKAIDIYLVMCFVFVFAALLEYAAVNYTYWGARAKRKAKKTKDGSASDGLYRKKEPAHNNDGMDPNDIRLSPLPAIRNSYHQVLNYENEDSLNSQPIIRMEPVLPRTCVARGYVPNTVLKRRNGPSMQKRKLLSAVKQRAKTLKPKLPTVRDVNVIDKYSRLMFPLLFIVFNITYWGYYLIKQYQNNS